MIRSSEKLQITKTDIKSKTKLNSKLPIIYFFHATFNVFSYPFEVNFIHQQMAHIMRKVKR